MKTSRSVVLPGAPADKDYAFITAFIDALKELNPGSAGEVEVNEDGVFQRVAWAFRSQALRCVRGGKRVFSMDAAFLKPGAKHDGQVLNCTGFDNNGHPGMSPSIRPLLLILVSRSLTCTLMCVSL
jgi:hypothetical protein